MRPYCIALLCVQAFVLFILIAGLAFVSENYRQFLEEALGGVPLPNLTVRFVDLVDALEWLKEGKYYLMMILPGIFLVGGAMVLYSHPDSRVCGMRGVLYLAVSGSVFFFVAAFSFVGAALPITTPYSYNSELQSYSKTDWSWRIATGVLAMVALALLIGWIQRYRNLVKSVR